MKYSILFTAALAGRIVSAQCPIWPDYTGITVPPNIAPLNFTAEDGARLVSAMVQGEDGASVVARISDGDAIFPESSWRNFLESHKAQRYFLRVQTDGGSYVFTNRVSAAPIASHLTYRLIQPGYVASAEIGLIYQRNLENFTEKPVYRSWQEDPGQCANCHTYNKANPAEYVFHVRFNSPGTQIVSPRYGKRKLDLKMPGFSGPGAYLSWHPSGDFIAFAVAQTRQEFYLAGADKVEAVDFQSDLILYSLADDKVYTIEHTPSLFDTFPSWSPDGKKLYSVASTTPFETLPGEEIELNMQMTQDIVTNLHYSLLVRDFDEKTRSFSPPRTLLDARKMDTSFNHPRVSPDGRWLVLARGHYGMFHIYHRAGDLAILDLLTGAFRDIDEINSPEAESYHTFTPTGEWMVFSSRRDDGMYTRPYFTAFDKSTGRFTKPFIIPVKRPRLHDERMYSYNLPEFSHGPIAESPRDLRRLIQQPAHKPELSDCLIL